MVKKNFDARNPPSIPLEFKKSEFLIKNPKHQNIRERQEKIQKEARIKAGLNTIPSMYVTKDIDSMIPSMKYKSNPKFQSGMLMKQTLREENIRKENLANEQNTHKGIEKRIQEKEDALFRIKEFTTENPNFEGKKDRQRQKNLEHYSKTFGNITIGVHGKELPKFKGSGQFWWENKDGYQQNPLYQSSKVMKQDKNPFKVNSHSIPL